MKPKPFDALNHFTLPVGTRFLLAGIPFWISPRAVFGSGAKTEVSSNVRPSRGPPQGRPPFRLFGGGGGSRTRVRKPSAVRPTCLAWSFGSRLAPAGRQADARPVASTDARGQATRPRTAADVNVAAPSFEGLAHQQASAASRRC